ncbi:aminopeptidase P family N-terminal domain-containing protein, partial [Yersinia pestis]
NKERPIGPPIESVCNILKDALNDARVLNKKIAIDLNIMSNGGKRVIDAVMPNVDFVDSSSIFNELRVIK